MTRRGSQAGRTTDRPYAPRVGNQTEHRNYKFVDIFDPLEWSIPALKNTDPVMLLTGSAGGAKSMTAANKIHGFCLRYKGATALVVRKTRTSMFNSTVAFMKKKVLGRYLRNGWVRYRSTERRFEYKNGSVIILEGMSNDEQRENIRSAGQDGGIDIAWMEEAHQFDEADFLEIVARMRGQAAPWRQIILSTNPDSPTHWIHQNLMLGGGATVYLSSAADNYHLPKDYIAYLDSLPVGSVERARLRDGKWVQAGGLVLDAWSDTYDSGNSELGGNVTRDADYIPGGGPVYWWVDDGYTGEYDDKAKMFKAGSHPRVFLLAQLRHNGRLAIFAESYAIKELAPDHIKEVVAMCKRNGWAKPSRVIYDKAAASLGGHLQAELAASWSMPASDITHNAVPVDQGNSELNTRLAPDENDVRMIMVHPRCKFLRLEMVSYKINPKTGRRVKDFDHGPDAMRLGIWDHIYGGPAEVDVATIYDVELPQEYYENYGETLDEDGITTYDMGAASIAAII